MGLCNSRAALLLLGAAFLVAAAGCSTNEPFEEPAPLPEVVNSVSLDEVWSTSVGDGYDDEYLHLQPLVTASNLYAVSADGEFVSVDPESGKRQWERDLDRRIMAGVGGDSQNLYLVSDNARLIAYNRKDGTAEWDASLPNEVLAPPQSNGVIVIAQTIDGKVVAFDVRTGEKKWQYDGVVPALTIRATAAPLVGDKVVLVSFANGQMFALSTDTGQPVWQYTVGEPKGRTELERLVDVTSQPVIVDTAAIITGYQGKLAAVDLRNGQEIWSRPMSSFRSPAIAGGNVFVARSNGDVVAVDGSTRKIIWTQDKLAWRQLTQPLVAGKYLVVGDFEGYLHVLSLDNGTFQGRLEFDSDGLRAPLQRWRDLIIVYGNGGHLAALKLKTDQ